MGNIATTYSDRVRYTLEHKDYGSIIIEEPEGWNTDEKELTRHETYHGVFPKFSNALQFVGDAGKFINLIYDIYGINAEIRLMKDERHPQTDVWTRAYDGYLDYSTKEVQDNKVSIKFNSGGLEMLLKARESEIVELERLDTIEGSPIPPLQTKNVELDGRRIFLKTTWDIDPSNSTATTSLIGQNEDDRETVGVPWRMVSQSHELAHSVIPETNAPSQNGTTGIMFFAVSDSTRTLHIKFNLNFTTNITRKDDLGSWASHKLCLSKYANGTNYESVSKLTLFNTDDHGGIHSLGGDSYLNPFTGVNSNPKKNWIINYEGNITLLPGESLALEFLGEADLGNNLHVGHLDVKCENITGEMFIDEDSFYEKTQCKTVLAYEVADRLITIATNRNNVFRSEFLGRTDIGYQKNGQGSYTGITHGHWVRGFEKEPVSEENKFKPLSTSFKDFMTSFTAVWNVGLGIEKIGYFERIIIEDLSYFYNQNVTIRLPYQAKKIKRTVAADKYFSSIEMGYEKGGDYEEAMGLDEANTKSNRTTVITRVKEVYSKLSKYRADAYGLEFARRKQKSRFPTEDTRYDTDIFMMDLKPSTMPGNLLQRKWQDDFQQAPTGIFSPETAFNLRFSPLNNLLRHSWVISAGLIKYPADFIRFGSSTANSALKTKLRNDTAYLNTVAPTPGNGVSYTESGNILNSDLKKPRFVPEEIEFEHEVTFNVNEQLNGYTTILGKKIPNVYGLVEFKNENGQYEKGFLLSLKPNGNGKWKLLKANR